MDMTAVRSFVWSHLVMIEDDGERIEQLVCRFDGKHERDRAHIDRMYIVKAHHGIGWKWAVYSKPDMKGKIAEGEETLLQDAMSACEETFYMTRDYYQERFEEEYMGGIDNPRIYGRF